MFLYKGQRENAGNHNQANCRVWKPFPTDISTTEHLYLRLEDHCPRRAECFNSKRNREFDETLCLLEMSEVSIEWFLVISSNSDPV